MVSAIFKAAVHPSFLFQHPISRFIVFSSGPMVTILSVDDELNPLILRKMLLEKAGYRVISASSGMEALRILQFEKPDLVLSDQVMREMSGTQFAREVKARNPEIPVIIITGLNDVPADAVIADLFMSKLEGPAKLLHNIERVLAQESSPRRPDQVSGPHTPKSL